MREGGEGEDDTLTVCWVLVPSLPCRSPFAFQGAPDNIMYSYRLGHCSVARVGYYTHRLGRGSRSAVDKLCLWLIVGLCGGQLTGVNCGVGYDRPIGVHPWHCGKLTRGYNVHASA